MAIFSSDLTEVAPKVPIACCVVGTNVIAAGYGDASSGLMPNGGYAILDAVTETARAFSGLPAGNSSSSTAIYPGAVCSGGGYGWFVAKDASTLYRVDPATGGIATTSLGSLGISALAGYANGYVVALSSGSTSVRLYRVSTGAVSTVTGVSTAGTLGAVASDGTYVFLYMTTTGWRRLDPATGTVTTIGGTGGSTNGFVSAGYIWSASATTIYKTNASTGATTSYSHSLVAGGNMATYSDLVLHSDGKIYCYGSSDYLIGFDPATGTFGKQALSPTRGRRYTVVSCNGKLWIPSGEPLT